MVTERRLGTATNAWRSASDRVTEGRAILGIDAAWTLTQPSGVALVLEDGHGWRLCEVAPSYPIYERLDSGEAWPRPVGSKPDVTALIAVSLRLCGKAPDIVAVDMPLANEPIIARRKSDNAVSREYGGRHCSTHSPSAVRPGKISDQLTQAFAAAGYPLATSSVIGRAVIEVYPHPALVELSGESRRLPYKAGKLGKYWPRLTRYERKENLIEVWERIVHLLDQQIAGTADRLALPGAGADGRTLKAFEDMLDAVICAWVGICVLEGSAEPYGDDTSAIWIPRADRFHIAARSPS